MKHISVDAFKEVVEAEANNTSIAFLNVCTPAEYKEKHIPGVQNIPLSDLGKAVTSLRDKKTIYVHCRSGNRGRQAIESLTQLGLTAELVNVEGGLLAWDAAGYTTASLTNRMPIMRQVLICLTLIHLPQCICGCWLSLCRCEWMVWNELCAR
jgi:rhodanese-related sulfurtransferase